VVALVGVVVALSQQAARDVVIVVVLFVAGLAYYYLYLHRFAHDRWVPHTTDEDVNPAEPAG
jgi:hypothetical protein